MPSGDTFLWVGSGSWSSSSNWIDLSQSGHPNGVPGASDSAEFKPDDTADGGSNGACTAGAITVGSIQMDSAYAAMFTASGGFTVSGLFFQYGGLTLGGTVNIGTMSINGAATLGGTLDCTNFVLYAAGSLAGSGASVIDGQSYDDVGTISVTSGMVTIDNSFTASAGSVTTVSPGATLAFSGASTVSISGTLNLGKTTGGGSGVTLGGAALTIGGTLNNYGSDAISGGDVTQDGDLNFIDLTGGFDTLTIGGDYSQTSNAITSMNIGPMGGANDVLAAGTHTIGLAGTLNVSGSPNGRGTWNLFNGATVSGGFATVNLPAAPQGLQWQYGISANGASFYIQL